MERDRSDPTQRTSSVASRSPESASSNERPSVHERGTQTEGCCNEAAVFVDEDRASVNASLAALRSRVPFVENETSLLILLRATIDYIYVRGKMPMYQ